jgi:hypothetical protein
MKKLESQLKELKTGSEASKDFNVALWSELEREFEKTYPSTLMFWRRAFILPLAVMVIFVSTGTGVYAYASPSVTQNHGLYPVKRGIESMEGFLPRSNRGSVEFHIRMMDRRIAEGEFLQGRHELHVEVLVEVTDEFYTVVRKIEAIDENDELRVLIIDRVERQTADYGDLVDAIIEERYEDIEEHREFIRNNFDGVRVYISESQLSDGEKEILLYRLDFNQDAPRTLDYEATR